MEVEESVAHRVPRSNFSVHSLMTTEDYLTNYWAMLRDTIDQMLDLPPGSYHPISYEQMYSAVYKCVCKQYGDRLYQDLINHVRTKMAEWSRMLTLVEDAEYIDNFHKILMRFFQALSGIVPIFTYMNRFYIEAKLQTDLRRELLKIFSAMLSDQHVRRLLALMSEAQGRPFAVEPQVMASLCTHLHQLNPEYAQLSPAVFSRFLPNVLPPMTAEDIQAQQAADRQLQETLRAEGWGAATTSTTNKKREHDREA